MSNCEARPRADGQTECRRCHTVWDSNDNKPDCLSDLATKEVDLKQAAITPVKLRQAGVTTNQAEQDEINRRGMAKLRESMKND